MRRWVREVGRGLAPELTGLMAPRDWFLTLGTLMLVVVWLYFGSAAFFQRTWGDAFAANPWGEWYSYLYYHLAALLLLGVLPLAVLWAGFGMPPRLLGIGIGDWRWGSKAVLLGIVVATPLVWFSSLDPAFQAEYPLTRLAGRSAGTWVAWELTYLLYYLGWECYFRGSLLFGLRGGLGTAGALCFQTAVSTLVHLGNVDKPFGETLGAAPAGFLFGALALRSGSVLWPLLLHWYLGALMDLCAYWRWATG